jgi:hypothetical protein
VHVIDPRRARRGATLGALVALSVSIAAAQPAPPADPYLAQVRDALQARAPSFRRCFEQALRRDPTLTGRADAMRFRVLSSGRVRVVAVRVVPRAPSLERCMTAVLAGIVLPPHGGAPIEVSLPLNQ